MAMNDETATVPDFPWDIPAGDMDHVEATMFVLPTTPIDWFDWVMPPATTRVVGLHIKALTIHLGLSGGDAVVVEVVDLLLKPLQAIRAAAVERMASPPPAPEAEPVEGAATRP